MKLNQILHSDGLMKHRLRVTDVPERRPWLAQKCQGATVLHVGCCDVPIFDANNNLHIELAQTTPRIDGLDISKEGLEVLKRHVYSDYFANGSEIDKQYDLVLAPEVLEHTPNPREFLDGIFEIKAQRYLITAPHFQWFEQSQRDGDCFVEQVHGDHRAWYSPYTLLNAARPFIDESKDELELFIIAGVGSVALEITKERSIEDWQRRPPSGSPEQLRAQGKTAEALYLLRERAAIPRPGDYKLESEILLSLGRYLELFRSSVAFMRQHPQDKSCLLFAADAALGLGELSQAEQLRQMAAQRP